jgi:hypothetical protein
MERSFESAARLDPLNTDLCLKIAKNYFLAWRITGEPRFALSALEKLRHCAQFSPESTGNCITLAKSELGGSDNELNIFPQTLSGELSLASYLVGLKRWEEARGVCERIEKSYPSLEKSLGNSYSEFLINFGTALLFTADLQGSQSKYENAILHTNDRDSVLKRIYLCFRGAQKTADGLGFWQKLAQEYPVSQTIWFNIGRAHLDLGDLREAETALQKASSIQETPETFYYLAVLYAKLGENPFARRNLLEAVRLDWRNPLYHRELAKLYEADKMVTDAIREIKAAIALAPEKELYTSELDRLLLLYAKEPGR